jgi:hypothetical protein
MHHVAGAALPVAIALLACAAVARAVLSTDFGDAQAQRTARLYLEPLCTWGLGALVVLVFARSAAGDSLLGSLAIGGVLGAAGIALRVGDDEEDEVAAPEPAPAAAAESPRPPAPPGVERPLWAKRP